MGQITINKILLYRKGLQNILVIRSFLRQNVNTILLYGKIKSYYYLLIIQFQDQIKKRKLEYISFFDISFNIN